MGRDREWWLSVQPKIIDFWEDVLHHREIGIQHILDKREEKRTKRIKLKNDKKEKSKKNTFEIDKSVVEEYGPISIFRKLNAVYIYNKNTNPKISEIFKRDRDWIRKNYMKH